ncbi:MAG: hypothetical protein EHM38_04765, partial [Geobacteraceae bacterium]
MTLKNWLDNGWLIEHATNSQEISDLLQVADRDLKDCETRGLSADWQLGIAYNAALQTATAALAACGFRSGRDAHHLRPVARRISSTLCVSYRSSNGGAMLVG